MSRKERSISDLSRPRVGSNVVKVSVPAEVAYDLDQFQRVQETILDRLGCPACTSGWDIRWDLQRNFLVDEKLNVREVGPEIG